MSAAAPASLGGGSAQIALCLGVIEVPARRCIGEGRVWPSGASRCEALAGCAHERIPGRGRGLPEAGGRCGGGERNAGGSVFSFFACCWGASSWGYGSGRGGKRPGDQSDVRWGTSRCLGGRPYLWRSFGGDSQAGARSLGGGACVAQWQSGFIAAQSILTVVRCFTTTRGAHRFFPLF